MENKRIMICGASGVGKTTLAKYMGDYYDIPYISTSASKLWPKYGFKSHSDALEKCTKEPDIGMLYQMDILNTRAESLMGLSSFVTDRSYIDNLVYLLLERGYMMKIEEFNAFVEIVKTHLGKVNGLIFIRYSDDIIFQAEGKRVNNIIYQKMVNQIMAWLMYNDEFKLTHNIQVLDIKVWDFKTRIEIVESWIGRL